MPETSDLDALIARAQAGELRAFELLVSDRLAQVRRFARAFAATEADADDLAQDALVKVYKSLKLFRYQAAFSTWLFTVVRNSFLDSLRSRAGRERSREEPLGPAHGETATDEPGAERRLEAEQERERLWAALRRVPPDFRSALVLFDLEGRSYDEVAAIEGVPVGTVKSRLNRGRAFLKKVLEEEDVTARTPAGTSAGLASSKVRRSG